MKPESIEVRIEELVLDGFAPGDRVGGVIERELSRLIAEHGVPPSLAKGGEAARLDGGAFEVKSNSTVETIGAQVAQAVYEGLSQ